MCNIQLFQIKEYIPVVPIALAMMTKNLTKSLEPNSTKAAIRSTMDKSDDTAKRHYMKFGIVALFGIFNESELSIQVDSQ